MKTKSTDIRKVLKFTFIYAVGSVLGKIVSIIMLPIYTRYLTPSDYGVLELISITIDVTSAILGLGLLNAVFRFYYKYESADDKKQVMSTAFVMLFCLTIMGIAIIFSVSGRLSGWLLNTPEYSYYIKIMALTMLFQSTITVPMMYIQAEQRPHLFVTVNIIKLLSQLTFNIYFVVFLGLNILGILYSTLISGGMVGIFLTVWFFRRNGFLFSKSKAQDMVRFGSPLVLSAVASFYVQYSDRYFLKTWATLHEVGLYSLAYSFGFWLMALVSDPFTKTWDTQCFEVASRQNAQELFQNVFLLINFITISAALGMSLFSYDFLRIMSGKQFWAANRVVPIILLAFLLRSWSYFVGFGIILKEKTIYTAAGTYIAAFVVTLFSYLLIPRYGAMGAAIATLVSFLARFFWQNYQGNRLYDLKLNWRIPLLIVFLAIFATCVSRFIGEIALGYSIALNCIIFACYLSALLFLPVFPPRIRKTMYQILKNPSQFKNSLKMVLERT